MTHGSKIRAENFAPHYIGTSACNGGLIFSAHSLICPLRAAERSASMRARGAPRDCRRTAIPHAGELGQRQLSATNAGSGISAKFMPAFSCSAARNTFSALSDGRNCGKSKCCRPGLTWRKNLAAQFEVSLRAEVKLRKKALVFYRKLPGQAAEHVIRQTGG